MDWGDIISTVGLLVAAWAFISLVQKIGNAVIEIQYDVKAMRDRLDNLANTTPAGDAE